MQRNPVYYKKGQVVQWEEPLVLLQTAESKRSALCCSACTAFLGDWSAQAKLISGKADPQRHRRAVVAELVASGRVVPCSCEGRGSQCQDVYCSEKCQHLALRRWHCLECCSVADVPDEKEEEDSSSEANEDGGNSMAEFEAHAQKVDEIFLAVRRVICTLILQAATASSTTNAVALSKEAHSSSASAQDLLEQLSSTDSDQDSVKANIKRTVEWYRTTFPPCPTLGNHTPQQIRAYELSDAGMESWLLLHAALLERGVSSTLFAPLLSQDFFACVLQSLEKYMHTMGMGTSPLSGHLARYLAARPAAAGKDNNSPEEEKYLGRLLHTDLSAQPARLQELLADKLLLITELNGLENGASSIAMAAGLGCDALFQFSARDCQCTCMVLLPYLSRHAGHSCLPDIQLGASIRDQAAVLASIIVEAPSTHNDQSRGAALPTIDFVALRDGNVQSGTTRLAACQVCYVDDSVPDEGSEFSLRGRQTKLVTQFGLDADPEGVVCSCPRCVYETARTASERRSRAAAATVDTVMTSVANALMGFTLEDTLMLGHYYMQQGMYVDAQAIYRSILVRVLGAQRDIRVAELHQNCRLPEGSDSDVHCAVSDADSALAGEVFHALGAAYLESGDWVRSRLVWRYGLRCLAAHAQLSEEVAKVAHYPEVEVRVLQPRAPAQSADGVAMLGRDVAVPGRANAALRNALYPRLVPGDDIQLVANGKITSDKEKHVLPAYVEVSEAASSQQEARICLTAPSEQLLSAEECSWVIRTTEEFAAQAGGWTTSRHYAVPTTDIPVHLIKSTAALSHSADSATALPLLNWFRGMFEQRLGPLLASQYQDEYSLDSPIRVAIHDAFVVKYDTGIAMPTAAEIACARSAAAGPFSADELPPPTGQTYLPLHCDQSSHSFTIALNSSSEYEGGGTYFPALGSVFRPDVGQVLSFPGGVMLHGGEPISRGTRYILAVFAYLHGTAKAPTAAAAVSDHRARGSGVFEDAKPAKRARQEGCTGFADVVWKVGSQAIAGNGVDARSGKAQEAQSGGLFSFNFA